MNKSRLWNRNLVHLISIEMMLQFGMYLSRPLISNYAVSLGATITAAGFLAGLLASAALLFRPVSGIVSDRFSKRHILIISCALFVISSFGCALSSSVLLIGIFLTLQGFGFALKSTAIIAMVPLVVPENRVGSGVGWMGLAYTIACALGPVCGAQIGGSFGYEAAFASAGLVLLGAFILAVTFRVKNAPMRTPHKRENVTLHTIKAHMKISNFFSISTIPFSVVAGIMMVAQGATTSFIILVGDMRGIENASLYFMAYSIATLVARPLAGKASDNWKVTYVVPPMIVVALVGMLFLAFDNTLIGVIVAGICMGVGQGSAYSVLQAESVRGVEKKHLGRAANTFYIGPDLGMGLGPIAVGAILQISCPIYMYLFNAATLLLALIIFLAGIRTHTWTRSSAEKSILVE